MEATFEFILAQEGTAEKFVSVVYDTRSSMSQNVRMRSLTLCKKMEVLGSGSPSLYELLKPTTVWQKVCMSG